MNCNHAKSNQHIFQPFFLELINSRYAVLFNAVTPLCLFAFMQLMPLTFMPLNFPTFTAFCLGTPAVGPMRRCAAAAVGRIIYSSLAIDAPKYR